MTPAKNFLTRILIIIAMIGSVLMLMRLTVGEVTSQTQKPARATDVTYAAETPKTRAQRIAAMAHTWTGSIAFSDAYAALTPLATTQDAEESARFNPDDDYWGLPRSEGVETVAALCGACHSLAIVMQQRQTQDGWNYLFDWMIEKQGMAAPDPEMRAEIIAYLSREFASE
ncbi:MAG: hypothetical protein AAFX54_04710 [Pseudomonadota bacterium]